MFTIELSGRRVLITGAGQNLGRGMAAAFAAAGAEVIVNDLDADRANQVVEELRAAGGSAVAAPFDVTDHDAVVAGVAAVGGIDVLVNNAGNAGADGFGRRVSFADSSPADWAPFLAVNVGGVLNCTHAVLAAMIEARWGRIITIVSDAGRVGDAGGAVYSAAKAAAAGLTRAVARENGRYGITANNISLGTMRTEATEAVWADPDSELAAAVLRPYLVRRPGQADDVSGLAMFLASDHAEWITGQTYPLNGGFSMAL